VWRQSFPSVHLPYYFSDRRRTQGAPFSPTQIDALGLEFALLGNNDQLGDFGERAFKRKGGLSLVDVLAKNRS